MPLREQDWCFSNKIRHSHLWFNCFLLYFQGKKHWHRLFSNRCNSHGACCLISIVSLRRCTRAALSLCLWCACEDRMESCFCLRCVVIEVQRQSSLARTEMAAVDLSNGKLSKSSIIKHRGFVLCVCRKKKKTSSAFRIAGGVWSLQFSGPCSLKLNNILTMGGMTRFMHHQK